MAGSPPRLRSQGKALRATVLERSSFSEESGAGIQLGPNATRLLARLGALEAIERVAFKPSAIWLFDGLSGKHLAAIPLGAHAETRYRAPYLTLHRADLHAALYGACKAANGITLEPRFQVVKVEETEPSVRAIAADGEVAEASALIGADGVWSEVRKSVAPGARLVFTGATAWRTLLPRARLGHPFDAPVVGVWLAPNAHLVHYPVRGGSDLNVVAITAGGADARGWNQTGDAAALRSAFTQWCKDSKSLVETGESWRCWSLHRLDRLERLDARQDRAPRRCRSPHPPLSRARSGPCHRGRGRARRSACRMQRRRLDRLSALHEPTRGARGERGASV